MCVTWCSYAFSPPSSSRTSSRSVIPPGGTSTVYASTSTSIRCRSLTALVKVLLTAWMFGMMIPAGIFLPTIAISVCLGRAVGRCRDAGGRVRLLAEMDVRARQCARGPDTARSVGISRRGSAAAAQGDAFAARRE
ncbi:hypothetical protein BDW22DRAFT_575784 [Trametopsis cervina]|nr:hypothetical protein BDW22DRAFT_575784 [Trametopsis cervina]